MPVFDKIYNESEKKALEIILLNQKYEFNDDESFVSGAISDRSGIFLLKNKSDYSSCTNQQVS